MDEDIEHKAAVRAAGQAYFESVLAKANEGKDPFQEQPLRPRHAVVVETDSTAVDPDVAAFGLWFERHRNLLLAGLFVVSQAFSWVLMKGALISMQTPAVLTFLHILSAAVVQLVLASWQIIEQPKISSASAKGALVQAVLSGAQVLLVMSVLLYSSVYMLLCWVTLMPLIIGFSRAADVSGKAARTVPQQLYVPLAVACLGLCLELLADSHRGLVPLLLLLCWCGTVALQLLWKQIKQDATLGHRIMDPEFLFRARELSDLEDALSPSSAALMSACLPAVPVLVLGLACLEGKDLVEHEPSVPTLSVLLLSCLAYAGTTCLRVMMTAYHTALAGQELNNFLVAAAALLAIVLDFLERAHALGVLSLLGVTMAVSGSLVAHRAVWRAMRSHHDPLHEI